MFIHFCSAACKYVLIVYDATVCVSGFFYMLCLLECKQIVCSHTLLRIVIYLLRLKYSKALQSPLAPKLYTDHKII